MAKSIEMMLSATKLPMLGKKGDLKPDADGYYELVVGGLNSWNNTKSWYYVAEGARELFAPGSLVQRRVANGVFRAEVNHPKQKPGESDESFFNRMLDIDRDNVCAHFKKIWLDEDFGKNNPQYGNPQLIAIMALVKPSLPKGAMLKESLDNPNENVCFSIRALSREAYVGGKRIRVIEDLISIDFVNEGGILVASKWDSPATESADNSKAIRVTQELLERVSKQSRDTISTESSREVASYIAAKHFATAKTPVYANW